MSELQLLTNHTSTERIELQTFELPQNYSILLNKLERLALGLDSAFNNLSLDRKEVEIAVSGGGGIGVGVGETEDFIASGGGVRGGLPAPPTHAHGMGEIEYSRVVSDIWIGVILTLLIVSVIFFICSCFLYHKFQEWKNSYQTNHSDPIDLCRRCPNDCEAESLPSYTIVSGLPTYDDALEEFRKAGILLTPTMPVIKIFDTDAKDPNILNMESAFNDPSNVGSAVGGGGGGSISGSCDNISLSSTCTCGGGGANVGSSVGVGLTLPNATLTPNNSAINLCLPPSGAAAGVGPGAGTQVIELSPEQLAQLSQKRLSLQIAFSGPVRRNSRPRVDLYREANRNNHMRSRAFSNVGLEPLPQIHRSSSSNSLSAQRNLRHLQHRGSLC